MRADCDTLAWMLVGLVEALSLPQSGTPPTPKEQPVRREVVSTCSMESSVPRARWLGYEIHLKLYESRVPWGTSCCRVVRWRLALLYVIYENTSADY